MKGSIQLGESLRENTLSSYDVYVEYTADVTVYKSGIFNWDGIIQGETTLDETDSLDRIAERQSDKDDGSYEIKLFPGVYDLKIEKSGFLAVIFTGVTVDKDGNIDLGHEVLIEGDNDRSGIIDLADVIGSVQHNNTVEGDSVYEKQFDYSSKGYITIDDLISTIFNKDNYIKIIKC